MVEELFWIALAVFGVVLAVIEIWDYWQEATRTRRQQQQHEIAEELDALKRKRYDTIVRGAKR